MQEREGRMERSKCGSGRKASPDDLAAVLKFGTRPSAGSWSAELEETKRTSLNSVSGSNV